MLLKLPDFFYPAKVCELKPTSTDIDDLKVFFSTPSLLEGLKAELPLHLSKADGVSTEMIKSQWWQSHEEELRESSMLASRWF